jgi:hypothetical protein
MAASWRLTTGLVVVTVLLLQLVAAQEAGTATWKHKREREWRNLPKHEQVLGAC